MIFDAKFNGRRKTRLVAGNHKMPDIPREEIDLRIFSMNIIGTIFIMTAMNT